MLVKLALWSLSEKKKNWLIESWCYPTPTDYLYLLALFRRTLDNKCSEIKGSKMYFYVYKHVLVRMYMYYSMHGYLQRPEEFVGSPGIRAMEGCTISWVLEAEPGSSSKATSALNCLIISPFPRINFLNVYFFFLFSLVTQGLTLRVRLASKTCSCLPFLDFRVLVLKVLISN